MTVTVDLDTLRSELAAKAETLCAGAGCCDSERPKDTAGLFGPDGRWLGATLGSGVPIGPETARRLACDATIIPMVLGAHSEPLDVGPGQTPGHPGPAAGADRQRRRLPLARLRSRVPNGQTHTTSSSGSSTASPPSGTSSSYADITTSTSTKDGSRLRLDHDTGNVHVTYPDGRPYELVSKPRGS